jgi:hypothetical protein
MIRVSNIRVNDHLADFRCDDCSHEQADVNVNTALEFSQDSVLGEAVGVGDAQQTQFQLDKTARVLVDAALKVYVDGVEKASPADYSCTTEGLITFTAAPGSGLAITADYNHKDGGSIVVPCTGQGCGRASYYPREGGGPLSQQLAEAKTA